MGAGTITNLPPMLLEKCDLDKVETLAAFGPGVAADYAASQA